MATKSKPTSPSQKQGDLLAPKTEEEILLNPRSAAVDPEGPVKETLLPVWGMVRLTPRELQVIDHPAFQRLFEVHQLGQTNLVYRGATHMRGEHAIGTVHAAQLIIEAIDRSCPSQSPAMVERWQLARRLTDVERVFIRLGALLHDIGHLPAGHTLEDELGLLGHHDGSERIELVLDNTDWHGTKHPPLRGLVDELYGVEAEASGQCDERGRPLSASRLLTLLISSDHKDAEATPQSDFRLRVCRDAIGNTICADLLDYLHRDWLHIGKPRNFDPRLLDYMEILTRTDHGRREDRLVINLGKQGRPRPDAVTAILDLLESRYQLSEIALYHRAKLAAAAMLERTIAEYRDTFPAPEQKKAIDALVPDLLQCSDLEVLDLIRAKLEHRREGKKAPRIEAAIELTQRLRDRRLHRELHVLYADELGGHERALQLSERFAGKADGDPAERLRSIRSAAEDRLLAVRTLEEDFALPPGSIVVYCPPPNMNTKIAEVGIFSKGRVDSLARLDEDHRISGGHLSAQQARFRRLWRIHFAIDREVHAQLEADGLLGALIETIDKAVLWTQGSVDEDSDDDVRAIAETLTKLEASPHFRREVIEPALNREQPAYSYPGGAKSIRSFIGPKPKSG